MCGIFGYVSFFSGRQYSVEQCRASLSLLKHRGPDGEGEYFDEQVYMGNRRLRIIDLTDAARQPFISHSQNSVLVYDGEIYNYKELSAGLPLRTRSDTEVLLEGYEKYGYAFFLRLRGMYAFCIYDIPLQKFFLYRDPAGIKPLYVKINPAGVVWASEIKALACWDKGQLTTNEAALKSYISLGYVPEPHTIYNEIEAVAPGRLMEWNIKTGQQDTCVLQQYSFNNENAYSFSENCEQTDFLLRQATARNQVADVDANIALSGGIDSSLLTYYSRDFGRGKAITISIGEEKYNEASTAAVYASHLGMEHVLAEVNTSDHLNLINKLLTHFDQPYADSSLIPFFFLCREASQYSKVLIGGDGGDEIHNGYFTQLVFPMLAGVQSMPAIADLFRVVLSVKKLLPVNRHRQLLKIAKGLSLSNRSELLFHLLAWFPLSPEQYPLYPFRYQPHEVNLFADNLQFTDLAFLQSVLFKERMQSDYLRKADMMAMLNSLEYRVPMLDEDLVSFSHSIPYHQKCSLMKSKKILRAIHSRYFPASLSGLSKKGFSIPLDTWLGEDALAEMKRFICLPHGIVKDYVDLRYVDILFKSLTYKYYQRFSSRESTCQRILILYALQWWYINKA